MLFFVLGFLVFIVLFTLAAVQGTRLAGRVMGGRVNAMHQAAESILETESVPAAWLEPLPAADRHRVRWARRQQRRAVQRIGKLRAYMARTPCIADVESREYVLTELDRIREQWRAAEPERLAAPARTPVPAGSGSDPALPG